MSIAGCPINIRMTPINITNFDSRWDFMAARSGYTDSPMDVTIPDYTITGRFIGNWDKELDGLIKLSSGGVPLNFLKKLEGGEDPYTRKLDHYDLVTSGLTEHTEFLKRIMPPILNRTSAPTIYKMIDWFGFVGRVLVKIHIQHPGQIFPFHFDDLTTNRNNSNSQHGMDIDPDRWARVEVQLKEWEFGHVWGIGSNYWKQWQAGEIMFHPWHNGPHGTANCGKSARVCLQITGETTDDLRAKLRQNNGDITL